ncbi:MAG: DUF459 domain-containing protein [Burkholderiaceae bacterium]|nr:DUF459 domain-containing protein [Burkholderiaceae bacterium]
MTFLMLVLSPSAAPSPSKTLFGTLFVLISSVFLIAWLRLDALDTYWLQTRHAELGLTKIVDHEAWLWGVNASHQLDETLNVKKQKLDELAERMVLAQNIIAFGKSPDNELAKETLTNVRVTDAPSPAPKTSLSGVAADLRLIDNSKQTSTSTKKAALLSSKTQAEIVKDAAANQDASAKENTQDAPAGEMPQLDENGRIVLRQQDKVLLVGDSMMQGVAPHVARALQSAKIKTLDLSKQSTGLAYPSYFNWPAVVRETIPKEKISVMVVFLGANDTWDMMLGGRFERFGTEKWQSVYASRVEEMVKFAESQHARVIWLGAPNMGREKINSGVKVLNQLYASSLKDGISRYLSTKEVLGDSGDGYQKSITKEDGKQVTVRTEDGIHFTRNGQKMLSDLILSQFNYSSIN